MDLNDDMDGPPRFNFDPGSLLPAFAITSSQPNVSGGPPKLNRRPTSLQILSPRARAANASKISLQPQLPLQSNSKDKGKGRVRPADIIELSDSDEEVEVVAFPTINSIPGPSQSVPSAGATSTNKPPPPALPDTFTGLNTFPTLIQEELIPRNLPPAAHAAVEEKANAEPRDAAVASTSNSNPLDRLIASVLEIIPDVDPDHLMLLFTANNPGGDAERASQLLEPILHSLFENVNYPKKQVEAKRKRQEEGDVPTAGPSQHKKKKIETVVKMNVATTDRPPVPSLEYYELSMVCQTYTTRDASYLPLVLARSEVPLCPNPLLKDDAHSTQEPLRANICTSYESSKLRLDSRRF